MASYGTVRSWARNVESQSDDEQVKLLARAVIRLSSDCEDAAKVAKDALKMARDAQAAANKRR